MATMDDSVLVATALAAGAAARFRPNNWAKERPDVDAYLALVDMIMTGRQGVDARMMEVAPGSDERRKVLAQQLAASGAAESRAVVRQSKKLLEMLLERSPETISAIFVDGNELREALAAGAARLAGASH